MKWKTQFREREPRAWVREYRWPRQNAATDDKLQLHPLPPPPPPRQALAKQSESGRGWERGEEEVKKAEQSRAHWEEGGLNRK